MDQQISTWTCTRKNIANQLNKVGNLGHLCYHVISPLSKEDSEMMAASELFTAVRWQTLWAGCVYRDTRQQTNILKLPPVCLTLRYQASLLRSKTMYYLRTLTLLCRCIPPNNTDWSHGGAMWLEPWNSSISQSPTNLQQKLIIVDSDRLSWRADINTGNRYYFLLPNTAVKLFSS